MRTLQLILGPSYDDTAEQFEARLQPADMMEASLVAQIVRAHWRLQYCEKLQHPNSPDIERVRRNAESSIRRNTAELRQLQADRQLNEELALDLQGIAKAKDILQSRKLAQTLADRKPSRATATSPQPAETEIGALMNSEQERNEAILKKRTQSAAPANASCQQPSRDQRERTSPHQALQQVETEIAALMNSEQERNEAILKKRTQSAVPANPAGQQLTHNEGERTSPHEALQQVESKIAALMNSEQEGNEAILKKRTQSPPPHATAGTSGPHFACLVAKSDFRKDQNDTESRWDRVLHTE